MSGIDLAKALVKQYPTLPVVISSGYGALDVQQILGQRQASLFLLPKPYDMPTLERTLNAAAEFTRR
jgi:DNA-binding NtrC family response regulator